MEKTAKTKEITYYREGCGDSDKPLDVSYVIKDHADRLDEFIHKLNIKKFHIVGHDFQKRPLITKRTPNWTKGEKTPFF